MHELNAELAQDSGGLLDVHFGIYDHAQGLDERAGCFHVGINKSRPTRPLYTRSAEYSKSRCADRLFRTG
jgi:hypothetical protein